MGELDEDAFVLVAVDVDLGYAGHLQHALAEAFGGLLELGVIGAVAGHHVEDGIDVGEFVIDHRAQNALRQLALHVDQLLAQHIEEVGHVLRRRGIAEGHLHRGEGRLRIGLHLLEVRQLLQLLLDGICDLGLHLLRGRARPDHGDVDHLHREERILRTPELLIGEEPGDAEDDHQEQHQRRVTDGPGRKIEALHRTLRKTINCRELKEARPENPSLRGSEAIQGAGQSWIASPLLPSHWRAGGSSTRNEGN